MKETTTAAYRAVVHVVHLHLENDRDDEDEGRRVYTQLYFGFSPSIDEGDDNGRV